MNVEHDACKAERQGLRSRVEKDGAAIGSSSSSIITLLSSTGCQGASAPPCSVVNSPPPAARLAGTASWTSSRRACVAAPPPAPGPVRSGGAVEVPPTSRPSRSVHELRTVQSSRPRAGGRAGYLDIAYRTPLLGGVANFRLIVRIRPYARVLQPRCQVRTSTCRPYPGPSAFFTVGTLRTTKELAGGLSGLARVTVGVASPPAPACLETFYTGDTAQLQWNRRQVERSPRRC